MKQAKRTMNQNNRETAEQSALPENDLAHVRGQYHVARALEVAAAGGHDLLLTGSSGVGKTMLARVLPTLLPTRETPYVFSEPQPDDEEFSLADTDVLFLRDMHVWKVRDLTRVWQQRARPIQLIATFQPCPCGFFGDPIVACQCSERLITRHQRRLAPFLGDFDIHIEVPRTRPEQLLDTHGCECSAIVRSRVEEARARQEQRGITNAAFSQLDRAQEAAQLDSSGEILLKAAIRQLHLSPQAVVKILRLARTIADLAGAESVTTPHVAEAIQYHPRF